MYIKNVILKNVGPHRYFEVSPVNGIVAVVGHNGGGKTTFNNAMYSAITNDFSRFGLKADVICDQADKDEEAYIELQIWHNGKNLWLKRGLRPNRHELKVQGDKKVLTKDSDIAARLAEELGVDAKIVKGYVFIDQGEMTGFLSETPAERAAAYKHLCRTEKADEIHAACSAVLNENRSIAEFVDNSDELVTQMGEADHQIRFFEATLVKLEETVLPPKVLSAVRRRIENQKLYDRLDDESSGIRRLLDGLRPQMQPKQENVTDLQAQLKVREEERDALQSKRADANAALTVWENYDKLEKRLSSVTSRLRSIAKEWKERKEPARPNDEGSRERYYHEVETATATKTLAEKIVRACTSGKDGECPTCKQKISPEHADSWSKKLFNATTQVHESTLLLKKFEDYGKRKADYDAWLVDWRARRKALREQRSQLEAIEAPTGTREDLHVILGEYAAAEAVAKTTATKLREAESDLNRMQAKLTEREGRLQQIAAEIEGLDVDVNKTIRAEKRLAKHEAAAIEQANINGQLEQLRRSKSQLQRSLDNLRAVKKRRAKLDDMMKLIERVRDVFHWNALPKMVAQTNMILMERDINAVLAKFDTPFTAEADVGDGSLGYIVKKPGKAPRRAETLSGGEKSVFSIAVREAINKLFCTDIGTSSWDEPTANLDADNIQLLAMFLKKLSAEMKGKRQRFITTHDESLAASCEQVIRIGG